MSNRREQTDVIFDIMSQIPGFNENELLEYTKNAILLFHEELRNDENVQETKIKSSKEVIRKILDDKKLYRITKDIDHLTVQHTSIYDFIENEKLIKVYTSIYFYDDADNNFINKSLKEFYWNDIWIITFKVNNLEDKDNSNCVNCGSIMKYDPTKKIFNCQYCGNIVVCNNWSKEWEIVDIEVQI